MANNKSTRKSSKKAPKVLKVVEKKEPAKALKQLKVVAKGPAFVAAAAAGGTQATINGKPLDRGQAKLWDKAAAALDELRLRVELDPKDLGAWGSVPSIYSRRSTGPHRHAPRVRTRNSAPRRGGDGRAPP